MFWVTLWQRVTNLKVLFSNSKRKSMTKVVSSGMSGARSSMQRDPYLRSLLQPTQNRFVLWVLIFFQ